MPTELYQPVGRERREEILGAMLRAAAARRRMRALRNGAILCAPLAVAGLLLALSARGSMPPPRAPLVEAGDAPSLPEAGPPTAIVQGWPSDLVDPAAAIVERRISDDELARLLRESGAQMGVVRVGHEVRLVPWNPQPDEEPGADPRPTTGDAAS